MRPSPKRKVPESGFVVEDREETSRSRLAELLNVLSISPPAPAPLASDDSKRLLPTFVDAPPSRVATQSSRPVVRMPTVVEHKCNAYIQPSELARVTSIPLTITVWDAELDEFVTQVAYVSLAGLTVRAADTNGGNTSYTLIDDSQPELGSAARIICIRGAGAPL